jgi:LysM repeat protein
MNNPSPSPSPLFPGSALEQKNRSRARVRLLVFFVLSVHVVGLMALLMQGCRRQETTTETQPTDTAATNAVEPFAATPEVATNLPPPELAQPTTMPPQPAPTQEYTVLKGDSLSTIAKKFPGVTVKQIQEANPTVQPTKLQIGQKLIIPAPSPTTSTAAAPTTTAAGEQLYKVKSGDTLTKIATDHGVTVRALRTANNLTTDKIVVGQELKIPAKSATAEPAPAPPSTPVVTQPGQ